MPLGLVHTMSEMGSPFLEDISELLLLDTRNVIDESVVNTVEALGRDPYNAYHKSVLADRTRSIHEPIKKNSLPLFRSPRSKTKLAEQVFMLKADVALFSRLTVKY